MYRFCPELSLKETSICFEALSTREEPAIAAVAQMVASTDHSLLQLASLSQGTSRW